jgi:hypothetical protein
MNQLEDLTRKPTVLARQALESSINSQDLERLLQFLNEVNDVLTKSFQPVLGSLQGVLSMSPSEIGTPTHKLLVEELERIQGLNYFNVRMVCNRLHGLRDHFDKHIRSLIQHLPNANEWMGLFLILDEREGFIQRVVTDIVGKITNDLRNARTAEDLQGVVAAAADAIRQVHSALEDMTSYAMLIHKHSDRIGFLTLTDLSRVKLAEEVKQVVHNDQRVTVNAAGATVSGAFVVGRTVSRNQIKVRSSVDPALSVLLERLNGELDKLTKNASSEVASEIKQDFKTLQEEVTKTAPRQQWYELSAQGLIDAAKAVGSVGVPVIETVKAIIGLIKP